MSHGCVDREGTRRVASWSPCVGDVMFFEGFDLSSREQSVLERLIEFRLHGSRWL
jgi:hypothetical protein